MFYVVKGKEKLDPRTEPNQREGRLEPEGAQPRGWEVFWGQGGGTRGPPPFHGGTWGELQPGEGSVASS